MSDIRECNKVSKLLLRCYSVRELEKSLAITCHTSGKKIEQAEGKEAAYAPSVWFTVIVNYDKAPAPDELALEDYSGTTFEVTGGVAWTGYINRNGEPAAGFQIFADEIAIHDWNKVENGNGSGTSKKKGKTYGPKR